MSPTDKPSWSWTAVAALPAIALAAVQTRFVGAFFSDDAFISLRYAARLLGGDGLTWTDGERVEGYSNLLWVLATAALGACGLDLVTAARALGGCATMVAFVALARAFAPHDLGSAMRAAVAPLLVASTQVVLGWTFGGLEGPFVLCFLACGFTAVLRAFAAAPQPADWSARIWAAIAVPFVLLVWTRPDAPLWVAAIATAIALAAWPCGFGTALRTALRFATLPLLAFGLQLGFRLVYHGDFVPNTAHVKAELDPATWPAGLDYVLGAANAHLGLVLPAIAMALAGLCVRTLRATTLLLLLPIAAWALYLVGIGGDHFPGRRMLHGAVVPLALLATSALAWRRLAWALAAALLVGVGANVWLARTDPQSLELRGEVWEWRGRAVGEALRTTFAASRPLLAVDAAGAVPFYSGLPCLDQLGLCDRTIARTPFPEWLQTVAPGTPKPPGHLRGNGRYVMDRAPDLLLFSNPPHLPLPVWVSAAEYEDDPRFLRGYHCVRVELPAAELLPGVREDLVVPLWVARDGKAGVQRSDDTVRVPAFLFASRQLPEPITRRYQPSADPALAARLGGHIAGLVGWLQDAACTAAPAPNGGLALRLSRPGTWSVALPLPRGVWSLTLEPSRPGVAVRTAGAARGDAAPTLDVAADNDVHALEVHVADGIGGPVWLESVVLRRSGK
ncbi:MAG: hypothetical protein JNK15_23050 [Planctomycetes bacterium]|nr:hypothetical protein [Planctomycetota bacterium]